MPALARGLGLGQPWWVVHIYSFFNVLSWLAMAWLLTAWLPLRDWVNFGRWTGCLLAAGVLESLRGSLTDLPSLLMMLAGMRLWEAQRSQPGAAVFTAGVLTRDTVALSVLGLLWPTPLSARGFARLAVLGGLIVLPTALWSLYVSHYFPTSVSGVEGNFNWPFRAVAGTAVDALGHLRHGDEDSGRYTFRLITIFSFAVQVWVVLTGWETRSAVAACRAAVRRAFSVPGPAGLGGSLGVLARDLAGHHRVSVSWCPPTAGSFPCCWPVRCPACTLSFAWFSEYLNGRFL